MSDWTPGWFRLGSIYTPLNAVYHLTEALHVHVSAVWMKMNGRFHDDEITNAVNQMTAVPYTVVSLHVELELSTHILVSVISVTRAC